MRNPTRLPALMIAMGVAITVYYGDRWRQFQPMPEEQVQEQLQIRVATELAQRGAHLQPRGEKLIRLVEQIEAEIRAADAQERREIERWLAIGLFVLVIGTGQWVFVVLAERMRHRQ